MVIGDIVIIPKKKSHYINVARISGHYTYDETAVFPLNHRRTVEFLARDLDTTTFDQDTRYSLGTYRTVFGIKQEERFIAKLIKMGVSVNEI